MLMLNEMIKHLLVFNKMFNQFKIKIKYSNKKFINKNN